MCAHTFLCSQVLKQFFVSMWTHWTIKWNELKFIFINYLQKYKREANLWWKLQFRLNSCFVLFIPRRQFHAKTETQQTCMCMFEIWEHNIESLQTKGIMAIVYVKFGWWKFIFGFLKYFNWITHIYRHTLNYEIWCTIPTIIAAFWWSQLRNNSM